MAKRPVACSIEVVSDDEFAGEGLEAEAAVLLNFAKSASPGPSCTSAMTERGGDFEDEDMEEASPGATRWPPEPATRVQSRGRQQKLATEVDGVTLLLSSQSSSGYECVLREQNPQYPERPFRAQAGRNILLGRYATAVEGAIAYAYYRQGPEAFKAFKEREAEKKLVREAEEGEQLAERHGLVREHMGMKLHTSVHSATGYAGVDRKDEGGRIWYRAQAPRRLRHIRSHLGRFSSPELAAHAYAKFLESPETYEIADDPRRRKPAAAKAAAGSASTKASGGGKASASSPAASISKAKQRLKAAVHSAPSTTTAAAAAGGASSSRAAASSSS